MAIWTACSTSWTSPSNLGAVLTPAACILPAHLLCPQQATPHTWASRMDSILSPIERIAGALGPTNSIPSASHFSENSAFSDKKPYPGCTACAQTAQQGFELFGTARGQRTGDCVLRARGFTCAPVCLHASIIRSPSRYDSLELAGPTQTASSALRTCTACSSCSHGNGEVNGHGDVEVASVQPAGEVVSVPALSKLLLFSSPFVEPS